MRIESVKKKIDRSDIVKHIKAGLVKDNRDGVAWRSLLESALFEIESLRRSRDFYKREAESWKNMKRRIEP